MRALLAGIMALAASSGAMAETAEALKAKPAKLVVEAKVTSDQAIACLQTDNSMNVQVIRRDGYVDMPMSINGTRLILATIIPTADGVRVEARGGFTRLLKRRLPCMGLPGKAGSI